MQQSSPVFSRFVQWDIPRYLNHSVPVSLINYRIIQKLRYWTKQLFSSPITVNPVKPGHFYKSKSVSVLINSVFCQVTNKEIHYYRLNYVTWLSIGKNQTNKGEQIKNKTVGLKWTGDFQDQLFESLSKQKMQNIAESCSKSFPVRSVVIHCT